MKQDTVLLIIKGIGLVGGVTAAAYNSGISQWANSGSWPGIIDWHSILASTLVAFFGALVAFCSGSVAGWRESRKNGNGTPPPKP
jgi:ABC-type transporter Mla maintaining outer membrane lipid asymmetry permease subunit MlaE